MNGVHLNVGSSVCQCAACGEVFRSVTGFDRHRTGDVNHRRCLTVIEMLADGLTKNERGQWITAAYDRESAA